MIPYHFYESSVFTELFKDENIIKREIILRFPKPDTMGGCCQKQVREHVETSKQSAVVPSWASSPAYEDEGTRKVKLVGDVTCPYTQRVRIALLEKVQIYQSEVHCKDLLTCML